MLLLYKSVTIHSCTVKYDRQVIIMFMYTCTLAAYHLFEFLISGYLKKLFKEALHLRKGFRLTHVLDEKVGYVYIQLQS